MKPLGGLTHNPANAVTHSIERIAWGHGTAVRKVLNGRNLASSPPEWQTSDDPSHWNFWAREALIYNSPFSAWLAPAGVRLPDVYELSLEQQARRATLVLEDIDGRGGATLTEDDYVTIASAWGRAQGLLASERAGEARALTWWSRAFLRRYTASKPVDYGMLHDEAAWQAPLIAGNWPPALRDGLALLHDRAEQLYACLEAGPQVLCHLDFWPNNVFVETGDGVVLVDLGFCGWGSPAEDIGNFAPDAVFDGFLPAERLHPVGERMLAAYNRSLVEVWPAAGELDLERLYRASAVKYVWLGPLLLARAQATVQTAYGGAPLEDAAQQYRARGAALLTLCEWAERATR